MDNNKPPDVPNEEPNKNQPAPPEDPPKTESKTNPAKISVNPFINFFLEMYRKTQGALRIPEAAKKAGQLWRSMDMESKKPYYISAKQAKEIRKVSKRRQKRRDARAKRVVNPETGSYTEPPFRPSKRGLSKKKLAKKYAYSSGSETDTKKKRYSKKRCYTSGSDTDTTKNRSQKASLYSSGSESDTKKKRCSKKRFYTSDSESDVSVVRKPVKRKTRVSKPKRYQAKRRKVDKGRKYSYRSHDSEYSDVQDIGSTSLSSFQSDEPSSDGVTDD